MRRVLATPGWRRPSRPPLKFQANRQEQGTKEGSPSGPKRNLEKMALNESGVAMRRKVSLIGPPCVTTIIFGPI